MHVHYTLQVFSLSSFETCKGISTCLIKDWAELLGKVGDNRSLLQSLEDSAYYASFERQAKDWETRLADLDVLLGMLQVTASVCASVKKLIRSLSSPACLSTHKRWEPHA